MANFAATYLAAYLRDLSVALVAGWFLVKYYPRWVDYRARRSVVTAKRRADKLETMFREYEQATADINLFVARIVRRGVFTILLLIIATATVTFVAILSLTGSIFCTLQNTCSNVTLFGVNINLHIIGGGLFSLLIQILNVIAIIAAFIFIYKQIETFSFECRPALYRFVIQKRIERLRRRVP